MAEAYTDEELLELGVIKLTHEEIQERIAKLREEAVEHERGGRLIMALGRRRQALNLERDA